MTTTPAAWKPLGRVMALGAAFDLAFAAAILTAPRAASRILQLDLPPDLVYLRLSGVLLAILGAIYVAAARGPERYSAVAPISAGGRAGGCLLLVGAWLAGNPPAFLVLGVVDLALGAATVTTWWRARGLSS
jgi:hypothetical protein